MAGNCEASSFVNNSVIQKAAGLTVPGRSLGLTGTIPPFHWKKCPRSCECPGGRGGGGIPPSGILGMTGN